MKRKRLSDLAAAPGERKLTRIERLFGPGTKWADLSKADRNVYERSAYAERKKKVGRKPGGERVRIHHAAKTGPITPDDVEEGIHWIEKTLRVPAGGIKAGSNFELMDWQKDWIRIAMSPEKSQAALSVARGGGKSSVIGAMIACFLVGPWNRARWFGIAASLNGEKSSTLRKIVRAQLETIRDPHPKWKMYKTPWPGRITGKNGAELQIVAADKDAGQSLEPSAIFIDELGFFGENKREYVASLRTSASKREGTKLFTISVQSNGPMFREMQEMAEAGLSHVHFERYTTPIDMPIDDREGWLLSNPGLGRTKTWAYMEDELANVLANPRNEAYFRSHDLNQDLSPSKDMVVSLASWRRLLSDENELRDEPVMMGIDLGETISMSAVALVGIESGRCLARGGFGDEPNLISRGRSDGVGTLYADMSRRDEVWTYPGTTVPLDMFMSSVFELLRERNLRLVSAAADTYGQGRLHDWWTRNGIGAPLDIRKTWQSVFRHADIEAFQRMVYTGELRPPENWIITAAIMASTLKTGSDGGMTVVKSPNRGATDALMAMILACGLKARMPTPVPWIVQVARYD